MVAQRPVLKSGTSRFQRLIQTVCISVHLVVSTLSPTLLRTLSARLSPRWQLGLGKGGQPGVPAAVRGTKANGIKSGRKWKIESNIP